MSRSCFAPCIFGLAFTLVAGCDDATVDPAADRDPVDVTGKGDDPADPASFAGVLPDFSPVKAVFTHRLLRDLAPGFESSLSTTLGSRHARVSLGYQGPSAGYSRDSSVVWTRDYFPIVVGTPDGLVMVSYLSVSATRSDYTGSSWIPVAPPGPDQQWYASPTGTGGEWRKTERLPLLHENGNLVSTGRWLILTDKLLRLNTAASEGSNAAHLREAGWKIRTRDEVLGLLAKATRTPVERIVVMPPMPGEKTDHADLMVMALSADEVMVPEIRDDALAAITYGHEIELGQRVREYLDEVATTLEDRGLTVHRLPMLAPVFLENDSGEMTGYNAVFYSPSNALQVHIAGESPRIWLPTFDPQGFPDAYVALALTYEDLWIDFFSARGMTAISVDATALGRAYGLFHCVAYPAF